MSTRANIVFKDSFGTELYFYRHSDGYPDCCGKDLEEFVQGYAEKYRANSTQSAGHLILRGHREYTRENSLSHNPWKVGAYEPTNKIHADVDYIYVIDLVKGILETRVPAWEFDGGGDPKLEETQCVSSKEFKMRGQEF